MGSFWITQKYRKCMILIVTSPCSTNQTKSFSESVSTDLNQISIDQDQCTLIWVVCPRDSGFCEMSSETESNLSHQHFASRHLNLFVIFLFMQKHPQQKSSKVIVVYLFLTMLTESWVFYIKIWTMTPLYNLPRKTCWPIIAAKLELHCRFMSTHLDVLCPYFCLNPWLVHCETSILIFCIVMCFIHCKNNLWSV